MKTQGTAAVFDVHSRAFRLADYPLLPPAAGQARLELLRSGICGTDMHICTGKLPMPPGELIIGHEFIGKIAELGAGATADGLGQPLAVGEAAIACVALPCGACPTCRRGETASCMNFGVTYLRNPAEPPHFFGGFAEHLHSPAANLVKLPAGLDLEAAAAAPCGGPTVIRAFEYGGGIEPGELVAVQGTGTLGLFAIAWAAAHGARVVAIGSGRLALRHQLALQLGAEEFLCIHRTTRDERLARLRALADKHGRGNGVDVVVETSGVPASVPEGIDLLRTRGRYLVPGQYSCSGAIEIEPQAITFKALRIIGSGQYTLADVGTYLDFLQRHPAIATVLARCVTHRYPVRDIETALAEVKAGKAIKAVLVR